MNIEDSVYATKFYSMQKQIDDQEETIKLLRAREKIFNDLCRQYREENDILHSIIKEVRKYIEEKEKDDDNWIDYELLIEPIRIKEILEKEDK